MPAQPYMIKDPRQLAALASPMRQEIVDAVEATGPCTIARLAEAVGTPADRLYFHIRRLESVGLLLRKGVTGNGRDAAATYDLPGRPLRISYEDRSHRQMRKVAAIHDGVLRLARRDFRHAIGTPESVLAGMLRDTWGGRARGWLTPAEIRRLNRLMEELLNLVRGGSWRKDARPIALSFVIAPPRRQRQPSKARR